MAAGYVVYGSSTVFVYSVGNGVHGFLLTTPASLLNGATHTIHVKFAGTATETYLSPKSLTCAP